MEQSTTNACTCSSNVTAWGRGGIAAFYRDTLTHSRLKNERQTEDESGEL
jgi:hypothetical protein